MVIGDEMLTPDSSRFWPADSYEPARCSGTGNFCFDAAKKPYFPGKKGCAKKLEKS